MANLQFDAPSVENLFVQRGHVDMQIAPSILTADFTRLGEVLDESIDAGIDWIHLECDGRKLGHK